jgi:signal transduction histidine kinase
MLARMESIQLSSLYRSLTHWPKTGMELSAFLENFSKLLPAPFSAVYLNETNPNESGMKNADLHLAFKLSAPNGTDLRASVEDFIKKQLLQKESLKSIQSAGSLFKQVQVSGDFLSGHYLGLVPITVRQNAGSVSLGWIMSALPKPFTDKEGALLIASAQRLIELAELELLQSEIQLRSQFLSIASHELKTPLTSIYGMLQLQERMYRLKKDDPSLRDPERQREYLKKMIRQVERLNEMIDGLLDISRIQNGRFMIEQTESDVASILKETIATRLSNVATEAGVKFHVETPEHLLAWVDPVRIEEVVNNLIMNAIRFSPEGGVIWIKLLAEGDLFRFTVRDQGPSVPQEDRERIFQPFERAQRTARFGGMGLGLFISRQIAQLHGGSVTLLESVPGKGNLFEATFPTRNTSAVSA